MLLFSACLLHAQQVLIKGKITDTSGVAIPFCGIQNLHNHSGTSADSNGVYIFRTTLPAKIRISSLGYVSEQKEISTTQFSDTIVLNFVLKSAAHVLQSVNITAEHPPVPLAESSSLLDFEIKSGQLCLLYETRKGERIEIADTSGKTFLHYYIHNPATDLHKTAHGFLYSLWKDSAYVYQWDTLTGFSEFSVPLDTFKWVALSIAAYRYPCYYYMIDTAMRTQIIYYYDNKLTGEKAPLFIYMNEQMFFSNAEINQMVLALAGQVGSSMAGMAGENDALNSRTLARAHISNQQTMLQDAHCELRIVRDSLYIFNFDVDSIYVFNVENHFVRSEPLRFDLYGMQYKNKEIIVDEEKRECYFRYEIGGITHLDQIDLNTGEKKNSESLNKFPFLEKIRISNGFAYFCYFDTGNTQGKRRVFKQQID
jgi:hypothetical protein